MPSILKNIILAVGLAFILWLGYTVFIKEDGTLLAENEIQTEAALEAQQFLIKIEELRSLTFDDSLFSDPRFQSLVDERQQLTEEPYGRENPFAPVPGL